MSTISRDDIKRVIVPQICCKRGCSNSTSSTRVRKTCDYHLNKSIAYRTDPEIREKQKRYMRKYYKDKRDQWNQYEWKKRKLETVLKLQQIPFVKIVDISANFENISIKLENSRLQPTSNNSPSTLPQPQTPPGNPRIPKRNLGNLFGTP